MNSQTDKEMERLLRGVFASGATASDARADDHLDVDELSAFAENALPPAARARYTVHLADCDQCRRLVADLSGAAGVAAELEKSDAAPAGIAVPPSRGWFAALLSWQTLRYALPIFVFMVIAGIVWQSSSQLRKGPSFYETAAVKDSAPTQAPRDTSTAANVDAGAPHADASNKVKGEVAGAAASKKTGDGKSQTPPGESSQVPPAVSQAQSEQQQVADELEQTQIFGQQGYKQSEDRDAGREDKNEDSRRQTAAPPPGADNRAEAASAVAEQQPAERNKKEAELRAAAPPAPPTAASEDSTARKRAAMKPAPSSAAAGAATASRPIARDAAKDDEKSRAAETRDVGGRRFRRLGDAWVDASYAAGGAVTNIRRGSEQYRAIVADEPGLRSISEQLGGEVIVVWKGRAYRFQ